MNKTTLWVVLLVIAGSLAAWYFSARNEPQDHPSVITLPESAAIKVEPRIEYPVEDIPVAEDLSPEPLPALSDSDGELVEALAALIGPEVLGRHFVLEQVISRVVTTIDALDSRQLAPLVMPVQPVDGKFQVLEGESISIDPANAARYEAYVNIASAVDTNTLIELYVNYYPLFQQAYAELGHGDAYFNDRLVVILDHLLATPVTVDEVTLLKPEAVYIYADESLEALSAGQKLLLRIGSANAAAILEKLEEIRSALTRQDI